MLKEMMLGLPFSTRSIAVSTIVFFHYLADFRKIFPVEVSIF